MRKYILLMLISLICLNAKPQNKNSDQIQKYNYLTVYKLDYYGDSTDRSRVSTDYWYLFVNDTSSLFTSIKYFRMDSVKREESRKGNPYGPSMDWYMANGTKNTLVIFKDHLNGTTICHDKIAPNESAHFVYDDTDPLEWELTGDTTYIGGQLCQQARVTFGGRDWVAWYNPDIPLFDGPYKFSGLPGLIYQIEDQTQSWRYRLVNLVQKEGEVLFNCSDVEHKKLSKEAFYKNKRDYYDNRLSIMKSNGYIFKDERRAKEEFNKDNNWIELLP